MRHLQLLVLFLFPALSFAEVELPHIFTDHMVLQRGIPVPVWGAAEPNAEVSVSFAGQTKKATADDSGKWMVKLDPLKASKNGRELNAGGRTIKDVLVGEVWICSGQSNMEWSINGSKEAEREKREADYPLIRHIKIPKRPSNAKEWDFNAEWQVCTPQNAGGFTAVGYFFGRRLHKELDVPVGLINSSWGGTRVEPWTPKNGYEYATQFDDASFAAPTIKMLEKNDPATADGKKNYQEGFAKFREWLEEAEAAVAEGKVPKNQPPRLPGLDNSHQTPTRLYNGMIHPLVPYAVKGAIWYQGESNGGDGEKYTRKLEAMIHGWREVWGQKDFPFHFVQLANFQTDNEKPEGGDGYARIREGMRKLLAYPQTGMAVIIDIGEARDIHPRNKQDVGSRLAQWALAKDYGKDIVPCGPLYKSHAIKDGTVVISFDHVGGGLIAGEKDGLDPVKEVDELERFAIAGADKKWVWADAKIVGDTIVVSSAEVPQPKAVRYAYSANPEGKKLYNKEGIPASPFRTDDW